MWSSGSGGLQRSKNSHATGFVQWEPGGICGAIGITRTRSSDRRRKVSFGWSLSTRPRQVSDLEEPSDIYGVALIHMVSIDMSEARRSQVQPRTRCHAVLNRNVVKMFFFWRSGGLDLDQTPSAVSTAVQDVHSHKHTAIFESCLEDGGDIGICDQLTGDGDRLLTVAKRNFDTTCEKLTGKLADFAALLHDGDRSGVRYTAQFWLMHLPIQAFEALHTCHVLRFRDCDRHCAYSSS